MTDDINPVTPPPTGLNPEALAEHIIEKAKAEGIRAEVKINPIPPHIAANICEFLKRAQSTGMEALAWAEAFHFMQQHVPQQGQPPGVPFNGLPQK